MTADGRDLQAAIAVTRLGLGARPGELAEARRDPQGFLKAQIRREGADLPAPDGERTPERVRDFREYREQRRAAQNDRNDQSDQSDQTGAADGDPAQAARRFLRQDAAQDVLDRVRLACVTPAGFRERWALFWANHFTVAASKLQVANLAGPYEAEAIRPHVFGRFADLLSAAEAHPAMLLYLDQAQSVGPESRLARRAAAPRRNTGLNENLAREILELHTVGVDAGYTQADVTEFARALTGVSVGGPRDGEAAFGATVFRAGAHQPGARTVMGVSYPAGGKEQAAAILDDLARKPQTARFVCTKLARHFVADDPPPALVARLERAWRSTDGDLARLAEALIDAPESWTPQAAKLKTPYEFVVSSYRALGRAPADVRQTAVLNTLGQRPFGAPSPEGWPDDAAAWAASDAMVKRMQFAQGFAAAAAGRVGDPRRLASEVLGARLTPASATAIARAESRAEAVALLLMTPEFQRR